MLDEKEVLERASHEEQVLLPANEFQRREQHQTLLFSDASFIHDLMSLQRAGFLLLDQFAPHGEIKLRASITLAALGYDLHRRGWLNILDGYYTVAYGQIRMMEESRIFLLTVSRSKKWAKLWWEGKLDIGNARDALVKWMNEARPRSGDIWADQHRKLYDFYNASTHANPVAGVFLFDLDSYSDAVIPYIGGLYNEESAKIVSHLYAYAALQNLNAFVDAFKDQLKDMILWNERCLEVIPLGWKYVKLSVPTIVSVQSGGGRSGTSEPPGCGVE